MAPDGFFAAANGGATQLYACVNQSSGEIKMIAADGTCPGKSAKVAWSVQGPEGDPGVANYSVHERTLDTGGAIAAGIFGGLGCPAGKRPLGGGVHVGDAAGYAIVSNRPLRPGDFAIDDPQRWFGFVLKVDGQASFVALEATMYAICAVVN